MRSLKKSIVTIMAGIMMFLAASSTIEAKNITSVNATAANGKIPYPVQRRKGHLPVQCWYMTRQTQIC